MHCMPPCCIHSKKRGEEKPFWHQQDSLNLPKCPHSAPHPGCAKAHRLLQDSSLLLPAASMSPVQHTLALFTAQIFGDFLKNTLHRGPSLRPTSKSSSDTTNISLQRDSSFFPSHPQNQLSYAQRLHTKSARI